MTQPTPGRQTTEFWLTLLTVLISNAMPLLIFYKILTAEEAELWQTALLALVTTLGNSLPVAAYTIGRSRLKAAHKQ